MSTRTRRDATASHTRSRVRVRSHSPDRCPATNGSTSARRSSVALTRRKVSYSFTSCAATKVSRVSASGSDAAAAVAGVEVSAVSGAMVVCSVLRVASRSSPTSSRATCNRGASRDQNGWYHSVMRPCPNLLLHVSNFENNARVIMNNQGAGCSLNRASKAGQWTGSGSAFDAPELFAPKALQNTP